jgi:hypothetical protein
MNSAIGATFAVRASPASGLLLGNRRDFRDESIARKRAPTMKLGRELVMFVFSMAGDVLKKKTPH